MDGGIGRFDPVHVQASRIIRSPRSPFALLILMSALLSMWSSFKHRIGIYRLAPHLLAPLFTFVVH